MSQETSARPGRAAAAWERIGQRGRLLVALVALVGVGALVLSLVDTTSGAGDRTGQVKSACRGWVKDRLKAPATADFSGESVDRAAGRYVVRGTVDSENGFGAKLRSTYTCTATSGGGSTALVSLDVT